MREDTVAANYAETLFVLAGRHEGVEAFGAGLRSVATLMENPSVHEFLVTPRVSAADKKAALGRALEGVVPPMLLRFLQIVVDKGRQRLLPRIAAAYRDMLERHLGRRHMEVTVARPLSPDDEEDLAAKLSSATGATVIPHVKVRPGILGGIVIREGDTVYDGSVKRQLDAMRRRLMAAELQP